MLFNISYPQIVYKQATSPAAIAGGLWYDTSVDEMYFSDGVSWIKISSSSSASGWELEQVQQNIEILTLQVGATAAASDYESMFVDILTDSTGYDNTFDTGTTTAQFLTNKYFNSVDLSQTHTDLPTNLASKTAKGGMKITIGAANIFMVSITKNVNCDATKGYILDATKNVLSTANFVGSVATFGAPYELIASTTYYLAVDSDGGAYDQAYYNGECHYPYASSKLNWIAALNASDGSDSTELVLSVDSCVISQLPANYVVRTNAQALSFAPVYCYLYCKNVVAGTGSVTYDISFDGGTTWDSTGNALNEKIAITDGSDKNMVIRIKLNGVGSGNTSEIYNYSILLWSI